MVKRGARVGAAAVALGLSLAGPHAGAAAADSAEQDTGPASTGASPSDEQPGTARPKSHAARSSATSGTAGPRVDGGAEPTQAGDPGRTSTGAPRPAAARQRPDTGGDPLTAAATTAASVTPAPVPVVTADTPTAVVMTPAAAAAAAVSLVDPAAAADAARPALKPHRASATAVPQAGAAVVMSAAVTRFFDSASNWMSRLPGGPVSNFLQGALLLVRRTLLGFIAAVGGQAGGQTMTSPYFSEAELQTYLLGLAAQRYGSLFGQTVPQYGYGYKWFEGALVPLTTAGDGRGGGPTSDTNTQVEGVDEADFVETDGQFVYVSRNGTLTILDNQSNLSSQTALSGYVVGQFLTGNRLTVITQSGGGWYGPMVKMAYGPWWDWNPQTTVTVFDVTDRSAPTVASQTVFDGSYRDARAVDGTVYLVLDRTLKLPEPLYTEVPAPTLDDMAVERYGPTVISYRTYETWDAYVARVGPQITTLSLPHAYSVNAEGELVDLGVIAGAGDIVRPRSDDPQSLVTVVSVDSLDAAAGSGFDSSVGSLVSTGGATVYMTTDALYIATAEDHYSDTGSSTDTRIDRFIVNGTDIGWQASGVVPGTLINQFAMDERSGYLRVATHTWSSQWAGGTWATVNDSGVYILDTEGSTLDITGSVTGLAPGEQLYAVRFVGDDAYLVTFLRTDPLFAVDLSDPTSPTVEGELVIPGFSNYLQSVGDGLLLGIGQEQQPGTWNTRLHVSLFDVSDGAAPRQIERLFLDESAPGQSAQWSSSDAQWDHHALLFSPEDGVLVVPVSASGYDPQTGEYRWGQTLQVLRVTADGIDTLGAIRTDGSVVRTVRIGDVLYAVSEDHVTAYSLSDFSEIGRVPLGAGDQTGPVPLLA